MKLTIYREAGHFDGHPIVKLVCSCGTATETVVLRRESELKRQMDDHWLDAHPGELRKMGLGACASCGVLTDHLKILSELGDAFLCPVHAPAHRLRQIFAGGQQ